ncbi:MAG: hypothetical protein HYY93_04775 [Planctomycetes bacterium]|nr:hypothetical protein [Planctomycetota bacterium]
MLSRADILFGKIAINAGMVSQDQIDECIHIQEKAPEPKPLGMILIEKGYISEKQLEEIIEIQKRNLQEKAIHSRFKREDGLFGRLVIRFGFATEDQVNEAVRIQAKMEDDLFMRMGEVMVRKGFLTNEQVTKILDYQKKKILTCPKCSTQFNVIMFQPGALIKCYKCQNELVVPEQLVSVAAEDHPASGTPGVPVAPGITPPPLPRPAVAAAIAAAAPKTPPPPARPGASPPPAPKAG